MASGPSKYLTTLIVVLLLCVPVVILQLVFNFRSFQTFVEFIQQHLMLYLLALFIAKSLSVVYPPLPGVALTLASIPLIGWELAYAVDILGGATGATISFALGKKYGYSLLRRMVGDKITDKIAGIRLKEKNQVEAAVFFRLAAGGLFSDGLAWGSGLIGFRYGPFIIGYAISHLITTLPIFYLLAISISLNSWLIFATLAVLAWLFIYRFKGRYFE